MKKISWKQIANTRLIELSKLRRVICTSHVCNVYIGKFSNEKPLAFVNGHAEIAQRGQNDFAYFPHVYQFC